MKLQLARAQSLVFQKKPNPIEALKVLQPLLKRKDATWKVFLCAGIAFMQQRHYQHAVQVLEECLARGGGDVKTYHILSVCCYHLNQLERAVDYEETALEHKNDFFDGWLHLGAVYRKQGELKKALKSYQKANKIDPANAKVAFQIGEIHHAQGSLDKALQLYDITLKIDREYHQARLSKAEILELKGKFVKAEECINAVLERKPDEIAARVALAEHYKKRGKYDKTLKNYENLLQKHPKHGAIRSNYALCLQHVGELDQSEKQYLRAFKDQPSIFETLSNLLMGIHYNPKRTQREIFEAHLLWDQYFAPEKRPQRPVPYNQNPEKRLRVGFLSGGFRKHPVGWMITSALEHLPKDQLEIFCYSTNSAYDDITKRIGQAADHWKSVIGYNDDVIADMIRQDEIDILVELSGHGADTRLKTVALEPAPVIVKWVGGLFNTTGLKSVDYLLSDHQETPKGEESCYTEKLVRLPDDYICFLPAPYMPEVADLPAKKNGFMTFGCFNNPAKVNDEILKHWASIMQQVPGSRLFLKSRQYENEGLKERIINTLAGEGIEEERIEFEGYSIHEKLLDAYNRVDIALDPWPYSGGLTTCEALFMGVPVITKPGPTFAGRHSATHVTNAGFPEWVADSWEEYIQKTVDLAQNPDTLAELRMNLREQLESSPVCDARRFGAHLATAFREMWKQRVKGYEQSLPEGEWQDHIDVPELSGKEIEEVLKSTHSPSHDTDTVFDSSFLDQELQKQEKRNGSGEQAETAVKTEEAVYTNGSSRPSDYSQKNSSLPETLKIETKDGVKICTPGNLEMLTPSVLLEQEQWYENELNFIRDYLKEEMNVADAGAGFGVYALPAAGMVGGTGSVFAFEPGDTAKKYLEMSKLENGLKNLEVIGKAVSDQPGMQPWKVAKTPELNKLDESGKEKVQAITLDSWWRFEGEPRIDLLKIDINGAELAALKGAEQLLKNESPEILISISEQGSEAFAQTLSELGYSLFEYIPGPGILAEHDAEAGADPYMQNLVAVHGSRIESLKQEGWLHDESVTVRETETDLWKTELSKLPWAGSLMEQWEKHGNSEGIKQYLQALNYLIAAEQTDIHSSELEQPRSQKAVLLLGAAGILINLYNQGANSTSVEFTLVRTLNALGKRGQAVEVMQKLIETTKLGQENMNTELPFMLPIPEQDNAPIKTDLRKWLMVRTVEAWILLKDLTTYLSGPQERKLIEVLKGNPEVSVNRLNDNKSDKKSLELTEEMEAKLNLPSKLIKVNVHEYEILIPKNEVFRLKNIFKEHEYSLPPEYVIPQGANIVDVGGNVGAFALYAAMWDKKAKIYSFEPNPQVFPLLQVNTRNHNNIKEYFYGLGDKNETLSLHQNPYNTGASSTSKFYSGSKQVNIEVRNAIEVFRKLDISKIDVLKIDTEGAEVPILKSLEPMFDKIGIIMLEYHSVKDRKEIIRLLKNFEFYSSERQISHEVGTIKCIHKNSG